MKKAEKLVFQLDNNERKLEKGTPQFTENVNEWLKKNPTQSKDSKLATEKIENVKGELDKTYVEPTQPLNRLKNPELESTFKMPEAKKKESKKFFSKAKEYVNKWGKRIMLTVGLSAISMGAKGETPNAEKVFTDSSQNKTEKVNGGMRKVKESEVTKDYIFSHKEGEKKVYKRNLQGGSNLEMAQPSTSKGGPEYEKKLISLLKSGISSQELADKNYGTLEGIEKIRKDNKIEYVDYVYTEPEKEKAKEVDPYAKYAVLGNPVYMPGVSGPNAGQMYYTSMQSKNIQEAGMTNTGDEKFIIRFEDANGKPLGITVEIDAKDRNKYLSVGGGHLLPGVYEMFTKKTYELTPEDVARGSTIKKDK